MAYQELTKDNFSDLIESSETMIVDFWAPWCGPCRVFGPVFERVSQDYDKVTFTKCNTEDQQELAGALRISAIPTLMIFREQILVFRQSGALPEKALRELLDKVGQLDMEQIRREVAEEEAKAAAEGEDGPVEGGPAQA